ncbi:MAG: rhodanese-like domain-containing protein [Actinomycetota bacterium]|nr:rhodanese-like domain-containing protein [Actinomycetota bacterium]
MEPDLSPTQVAELLARGGIELVDVRQAHEHEAGRITGDIHIELSELAERAPEMPRDAAIVFYCRSGARSGMAAQAFRGAGYDAHNLAGGLLDWVAAGLPLEPADGYVADA